VGAVTVLFSCLEVNAVVVNLEWLSPSQAANRLGLSSQQVRRLADSGRLTVSPPWKGD
jgi:hypothetical protein